MQGTVADVGLAELTADGTGPRAPVVRRDTGQCGAVRTGPTWAVRKGEVRRGAAGYAVWGRDVPADSVRTTSPRPSTPPSRSARTRAVPTIAPSAYSMTPVT